MVHDFSFKMKYIRTYEIAYRNAVDEKSPSFSLFTKKNDIKNLLGQRDKVMMHIEAFSTHCGYFQSLSEISQTFLFSPSSVFFSFGLIVFRTSPRWELRGTCIGIFVSKIKGKFE